MNEVESILTTSNSTSVQDYKNLKLDIKDNFKYEEPQHTAAKCFNIENTVCLLTLQDEILDYISIRKEDTGTLNNVNFNIDINNPNYIIGAKITVKKIELSYDFIGLVTTTASNTEIAINGETFNITPTSLYNISSIKLAPIHLFNESNGTIDLQLPPCESEIGCEIRLRAIEKDRGFQVSNLKIAASGLIGENSFTATADISGLVTPNTNIISISKFGISNFTFAYKTCFYNNIKRIKLNENIDSKLILDCVEPTSNYCESLIKGKPGRFLADIDVSFIANKKVYIINKENSAVFTEK